MVEEVQIDAALLSYFKPDYLLLYSYDPSLQSRYAACERIKGLICDHFLMSQSKSFSVAKQKKWLQISTIVSGDPDVCMTTNQLSSCPDATVCPSLCPSLLPSSLCVIWSPQALILMIQN